MKFTFWVVTLLILSMYTLTGAASGLDIELTSYETIASDSTFVQGRTQPNAIVIISSANDFHQEQKADSQGSFQFYSLPLQPGENRFLITAKTSDEQVAKAFWVRAGSPASLLAIGFVSVELGQHRSSGDGSVYTPGVYTLLAGELFLRRTVNEYTLTLAASSFEQTKQQSLHRYPVMGDTSSTSLLAASQAPYYLKVEHAQSYFLWGDYRTEFLSGGELINYNRLVTGPHLHYASPTMQLDLAYSATDRRSHTDLIAGKGISGFYYLTNPGIVKGSEQISIITMDAETNSKPLAINPLQHGVDYEIEYSRGAILFTRPIPMDDGIGNPIYISAHYEYNQDDIRDLMAGSFVFYGTQSQAQLNAFREGDYLLAGGNFGIALNQNQTLRGEVAMSHDSNNSGRAWLAGWDARFGSVSTALTYTSKEAGFANRPEIVSAIATKQTDANLLWTGTSWALRALAYNRTEQGPAIDRQTSSWTLEAEKQIYQLTLHSRLRYSSVQPANALAKQEYLARAGIDYALTKRSHLSAARQTTLAGDGTPGIGLWEVALKQQLASTVAGRIGYRRSDDGSNSALFSLENHLATGESGSTTLNTTSEVSQSEDGWSVGMTHGITSTLAVSKNLGVDLHYQRKVSPGTIPLYAAAFGWQYRFGEEPHKLSGKIEQRIGETSKDQIVRLELQGQTSTGFFYQAEYRWFTNLLAQDNTKKLETALFSYAYRPVRTDRYSLLGLVRFDRDSRSVLTMAIEGGAWVSRNLELATKLGFRSTVASGQPLSSRTQTMLLQLRGSYRLTKRVDYVASVRHLNQNTSQSQLVAWQQGLSYHLTKDGDLRLEVGYKSTGYDQWSDDPNLVIEDGTASPYIRLTVVF